jgi:hypothetical protein
MTGMSPEEYLPNIGAHHHLIIAKEEHHVL